VLVASFPEMMMTYNPPDHPSQNVLEGNYCNLERLSRDQHYEILYDLVMMDPDRFLYLSRYPHPNKEDYQTWFGNILNGSNVYYVVWHKSLQRYTGIQSFMRIDRTHGVIEIGDILWSSLMSRTTVATETIYILLSYAIDRLGYRRVEWKCDSLNLPSRRAAARFGFSFEGIFRQHSIIKGKNRDTAWYSLLDGEWKGDSEEVSLRRGYESWLAPTNFDETGKQIASLSFFNPSSSAAAAEGWGRRDSKGEDI
jgi:RimJ/RimL family protein N-acetyltransferase